MEILDSALSRDINKIISSSNDFKRQYWTLDFHSPVDTIAAFKVISIDRICDYESNFTDEIIVRLLVPLGKYSYRIYPYLDHLEATLYRFNPKSDVTQMLEGAQSDSSERFVVTVINPPAPAVEMNHTNQPSEGALDVMNFMTLDIQLINKAVNQMRMRAVGGSFRDCNSADVIKYLLTSESQKIEVSSEYLPKGVDMIPPTDPVKRKHIVIPQGTRLVDVPNYIQKHCGGVYSTGLSYYFQNDTWFVHPSYDTARYDTTEKILTIINVPANKMPGIEKTYILDGNHLSVIATGETKVANTSEKLLLNEGNGVRFADANKFMESFVETTDNKAIASRGRTNNEFITVTRGDGDNNVMISNNPINANPMMEYSKLAARDGVMVLMSWENSDPSLIYPGMPVRMKYLDGEEIREIDGVVLKVHHYIQLGKDGIFTSRHLSTTNIALFVKRSIFKKK